MNKYAELKKKHQKELNKLPMKAAFGKERFKKMMEEWGLTTNAEDISKIDMLIGGCYCLKKDTHLFEEYFQRTQKELEEFLKYDDILNQHSNMSSLTMNADIHIHRKMRFHRLILPTKRLRRMSV